MNSRSSQVSSEKYRDKPRFPTLCRPLSVTSPILPKILGIFFSLIQQFVFCKKSVIYKYIWILFVRRLIFVAYRPHWMIWLNHVKCQLVCWKGGNSAAMLSENCVNELKLSVCEGSVTPDQISTSFKIHTGIKVLYWVTHCILGQVYFIAPMFKTLKGSPKPRVKTTHTTL